MLCTAAAMGGVAMQWQCSNAMLAAAMRRVRLLAAMQMLPCNAHGVACNGWWAGALAVRQCNVGANVQWRCGGGNAGGGDGGEW